MRALTDPDRDPDPPIEGADASLRLALQRNQRLLAALSETNDAILRARSADELYTQVCEAVVHGGRFVSAGIFLAVDKGEALQAASVSGSNSNLGGARLTTREDSRFSTGLAATAFRLRRPSVSNDCLADPRLQPWRQQIDESGVRSGAGVPLISADGAILGVLLLYSSFPGAFDEEIVGLLERIAANICFCLRNLEREQERLLRADEARRHAEELQRFRMAMDMCGDAIYLVDPVAMRFLDVNDTACRETGYRREELLAMCPSDVVQASREQLAAAYEAVIAAGDAGVVMPTLSRPKDGRERRTELHRRALRVGGSWLIVTVARDITARVGQERLLAMEHSVTRNLARGGSIEETLSAVLQDICRTADWHSSSYYVRESEAGHMRFVAGWTQPPAADQPPPGVRPYEGSIPPGGLLSHTVATAAPVWVADVDAPDYRFRSHLRWRHGVGTQARSRLTVPVFDGPRACGVIAFSSGASREPDERLLQTMRVIADQIGQFLARKRAEEVLRESEARFRALTELSSDWYWEQDAEYRFLRIGHGGRGLDDELALFAGHRVWELPARVQGSADFETLRLCMQRHQSFRDFQFAWRPDAEPAGGGPRWISLSGEPQFDANDAFAGYRGVSKDITDKRRAQDRIQHLATHDALTGLPNRTMFAEVLAGAIERARAQQQRLAVLFVDLDRFKLVNDTLGHDAGDALLVQVAQRLRDGLRSSELLARLGGDEFVVLVPQVSQRDEVTAVARKIIEACVEPLQVAGHECCVSASVGVALFPDDADGERALMRAADMAMYAAKQRGRNRFEFGAEQAAVPTVTQLSLEAKLRRAAEEQRLHLHYQPKLCLRSGRITGAEALLRWHDAEIGNVPPGDFVPLAEALGLIVPIGNWVLAAACAQNMAWRRAGLPPISIAVNVSAYQLDDDALLAVLDRVLATTGMPGGALELEITEGTLVRDVERTSRLLADIKRRGVRLAIDDFGTGYSSPRQLKRFPIDTLKIDRSFIGDIPGDAEDVALTQATIAMGKALRLHVVAEGVETATQERFLRDHGCDEMQGYLFSRPLSPEAFVERWRAHLAPVEAVGA